MKPIRIKYLFVFAFTFLALLSACIPIDAETEQGEYQIVQPDQFLVGDIYRLQKHQIIRGNIAGIGTTLILEEGSLVDGNISLVGSQLVLAGRVTQDINLVAGTSEIKSSAIVLGNINRILQSSKIDPDAAVFGDISDFQLPATLVESIAGGISNIFAWSQPQNWLVVQFFQLIIFIALSLFVRVLFKPSSIRVSKTLRTHTLMSWLIGAISFTVGLIVAFVLIISICLSLGGLALLFLIFIGCLYGIGMLGYTVGNLTGQRLHINPSDTVISIIGGLILSMTFSVIAIIPCLGAMINATIICCTFGAVLISSYKQVTYKN